jgi:hypothetical protein
MGGFEGALEPFAYPPCGIFSRRLNPDIGPSLHRNSRRDARFIRYLRRERKGNFQRPFLQAVSVTS